MNIWTFNHDACMPSTGPLLRHYYFAEELGKRGHRATVFASNHVHFNNKWIPTGKKKYVCRKDDGVPFVFVKTSEYKGNGFSRVKNMLSYYFNLFSVTKEFSKIDGKPDVIIGSSVHPLACVAGIQIAKKFRIPCIVEIRDLWPEAIFTVGYIKEKSIIGRVLSAGEKWIYEHGDAIIFTKEGDTDHLKEQKWDIAQGGRINLKDCYYINNGVNLKEFYTNMKTTVVADKDLENNLFKVIYTGSIRKVNNVDQIIDAAALLRDCVNIQFLIYGTGNQFDRLKQRVKEEKLTNVVLKGFVEKGNIPYILSKASVNLLNYSQNQYNWSRGNSSNKLFEYMASGKPVISTVKMGYSIIDRYQCGLVTEECTPQGLADSILKIYKMTDVEYRRMSENAAEGAKNFDFPVLTDALEAVLLKVAGK